MFSQCSEVIRKYKTGILTKREVFRWSLDASHILDLKEDIRSDFFTFGPAKNSKFCLLLETDPAIETSVFSNGQFGVCLLKIPLSASTDIKNDVIIKVSFSLMDIRNRLHHTCERIMKQNKVYAHFDRILIENHQLMLLRRGVLTINCALDVEEVVSDDTNTVPDVKVNGVAKIQLPSESRDLVEDLSALLDSQKLNDTVLTADGKDFKVHRAILAIRSPVFAAMFEHETFEKINNRVIIKDISSDVLLLLLRFIYTSEIGSIEPNVCLALFVAADKYSIPKLRSLCSSMLCTNLTIEVVVNVLNVANLHADSKLKEAAIDFILENAMHVMQTDDWINLLKNDSELANSFCN